MIVVMPAISHPLVDIAAHVIEAERIRLETADIQGLRRLVGFIAAFAIGHCSLELVAPPKLAFRPPAGGVLPLGFGWKPKRLLRSLGKPFHELLRIRPA